MSPGVILSRRISGENNYYLTLFLKEYGIMKVSAPSNTCAGEKEPFIWARFKLRKKQRSRSYFIEDIEVADDMLGIRKGKDKILSALRWCALIMKHFEPSQPDDKLFGILFRSMKLLAETSVPPEALSWRFIWQWLNSWGLAPNIQEFFAHKRFAYNEIMILDYVSHSGAKELIGFFNSHANIPGNFFRTAFNLSAKLLQEK